VPTFSTALPTTVLLDAGVVSYNSGTALWMTRGGVKVDLAEDYQNIDFDGKRANVALLDRKTMTAAKMSFRIIQNSVLNLAKLMNHGGVSGMASLTLAQAAALTTAAAAAYSAFGDGIWPNMSRFMQQGEYLTNVRGTFKRGDGGTAYVAMALAKVTWTSIQGAEKDAAEQDVVIEARQDLSSATDTDVAPWSLVLVDP
jgi:hypothetical protein